MSVTPLRVGLAIVCTAALLVACTNGPPPPPMGRSIASAPSSTAPGNWGCASPNELSAVKAATIKQRLMVAGYTCQASDDYNRFVRAYRADLRASDAELQHFFYRLHGSAGDRALDSFKTRIANVSMVDSSRDATSYCASTQAAFRDARNVRGNSLERFLATQSLTTTEQFTPCEFATANNFR